MVLHEEHHHHFHAKSSGSSSRSSSKKNKAKKIPQRGLGVAQLEKLRIEEQQKTSNTGSSSSSSNPVAPPHPLVLPVSPPQPQQQRQQPSLPFASPRDPSPLIRSATSSLLPTVDFFKPDQIGFSASNAEELKYLSSIWSEDLSNLNAAEAAMSGKFAVLGANQHQYMSPIRLINNKAGFIPLSSRVNLQMEPPSNQNYSISSSQHEKERIAGTNLPWPFHPETAVSFPCKAPHFCTPFLRPEEYGKSPSKFDYNGTAFSKEGSSSSNLYQDNWRNSEIHAYKRLKKNGASADGEFLSLGTSKLKQPILPSRQPEHPEISLLQSQGAVENAAKISVNSSRKPFYSFLPMGPTGHDANANEEGDSTVNGVDTSLKL